MTTNENMSNVDSVNGVQQIRNADGCLRVGKGDVVEVYIDYAQKRFIGKITSVTQRFGLINGGTYSPGPFIRLLTLEGEEEFCDVSLVVRVLERGLPGQRPENIYAEDVQPQERWVYSVRGRKSVLGGPLSSLAALFLAEMHICLERPIDSEKLHELYHSQGMPGCIRRDGLSYCVRAKTFSKWVKTNAERILMTVAQTIKFETTRNLEWEADGMEDFEEYLYS
tara:strand:- start:1015 stop:1686 length:672 start_codon:yes stop_codon:yes gene_type:complete